RECPAAGHSSPRGTQVSSDGRFLVRHLSCESCETFVWRIRSRNATVRSMLSANRVAPWDSPVFALAQPTSRAESLRLSAHSIVNHRADHRSAPASELAPVAASDVVRLIARVLIALTVALSIIDVWQLEFIGQGDLRVGLLAAAVTIPLHIRHLIYGVRGERPPAGAWTLAIMAIATFAGVFAAGVVFSREFAPLAVSIFIVVPGARAFVMVGALIIAGVVIAGPLWSATAAAPIAGFYLAFVIIWRTTTQIIPLRL